MTYFEKPDTVEEALAHYGIMGMRWGKHKAQELQVRELDKQHKAQTKAVRDAEIEAARQRYNTSARKNYLDAKAQYKKDKLTIGKRAAKDKLEAVKWKNYEDYQIAQQAKSGKETALAVLGVVGTVSILALGGAIAGAAAHR